MAIFIPRGEAVEEIDWKLYFTPFISDLWQMILISSVVLAISLYLMEYIKLGKRPVHIHKNMEYQEPTYIIYRRKYCFAWILFFFIF